MIDCVCTVYIMLNDSEFVLYIAGVRGSLIRLVPHRTASVDQCLLGQFGIHYKTWVDVGGYR